MIKENKDFFLYVLGTVVLAVVVLGLLDYLFPGIFSSGECGLLGYKCIFQSVNEKEMVYEKYPEMIIDKSVNYTATVKTNFGDFKIKLYAKNAPKAVNSFVFLSNEGYYENVKFHRVINRLLIQTGDRNTLDDDPENDGSGGPGYTFKDEINWNSLDFSKAKIQQLENLGYKSNANVSSRHLKNKSLALANNGPNSNGSQFFVVIASSEDSSVKNLEGRYTVFGEVISGWNVVEKIGNVEVNDPNSNSPRPLEDIVINEIQIDSD